MLLSKDRCRKVYGIIRICMKSAQEHRHLRPHGVKAETKETMRRVAPTVLGMEFPDPECGERVHDHDHDHDDGAAESAGFLSATRHLGGCNGSSSNSGSGSDSFPAETWDAASSAFYNDDTDSWDATAGIVPSSVSAPIERETSKCGEKLAPMWAVDSYLGSLEWLNEIEEQHGEERLIELRQAVDEYKELGSPRPDVPDPPPD